MQPRNVVRIGPSHYHVGHIVPAMVAKEMPYFEEEGLAAYDLYHGGLIPAIAETIALRRAMTEKGVDITPDVKGKRPVFLAGYGHGGVAKGVHDPLMASGLVVEARDWRNDPTIVRPMNGGPG